MIGMVLAVTGMLLMAGGLSSRSLPAIVTGVVFFAVAASAFLSAEKDEKRGCTFRGRCVPRPGRFCQQDTDVPGTSRYQQRRVHV